MHSKKSKGLLRYITICFLPLFLLWTPPHISSAQNKNKEGAKEHYRLGQIYYEHGLYKEARGEFEKALEVLGSKQKVSKREDRKTAKSKELPVREYIIGIEDVLYISVWGTSQLNQEVIVRPDGRISFPLIGDVKAAGLTVRELDKEITQELVEFIEKKFGPSMSRESGKQAKYLIGLGDVLNISVWKIPDLSRDVIVRPDGMLSFPLIGDIQAAGKTLTELDEKITQKLSSYVKNPQVSIMVRSFGWKKEMPEELFLKEKPEVSVIIRKFGGRKVIVLGEVAKPGVYEFTHNIRILQAIGLAGGCTKYAVRNNVLVIRGDIRQHPQVISSNLLAVIKKAKLSENVPIKPQDVVYVPRSFIGNIQSFLEDIAPVIDRAYNGIITEQAISTR